MLHCLELCLAQGGALQDLVAIPSVHLVISMPSSQATVGHCEAWLKTVLGACENTRGLELERRHGNKNKMEVWFMDSGNHPSW